MGPVERWDRNPLEGTPALPLFGGVHPMHFIRNLSMTAALVLPALTSIAQIDTVQTVAPGVYFHQGDPRRGHSNNTWVVFEEYVFVIDANYPSGAKIVIPKVRESTHKPIRFVVDTHHHSDHAFGNQLWADEGVTILAHDAVLAILKSSGASAWEASAQRRPDVAATKLKLPDVLYPDSLVFDDGTHRVELHWLGVAHTSGDTFVWLPREKILITGDACVNGPHNLMRDGDSARWIETLERAKKLGAEKILPGHGPMGGPEVIADQQAYFVELRRTVQTLVAAKKTLADVKAAAPDLVTDLKRNAQIARYVPGNLQGHLEKVFAELTSAPSP